MKLKRLRESSSPSIQFISDTEDKPTAKKMKGMHYIVCKLSCHSFIVLVGIKQENLASDLPSIFNAASQPERRSFITIIHNFPRSFKIQIYLAARMQTSKSFQMTFDKCLWCRRLHERRTLSPPALSSAHRLAVRRHILVPLICSLCSSIF